MSMKRKTFAAVALGTLVMAGVARAQNSRSYWEFSQRLGSSTYSSLYGSDGSYALGYSQQLGTLKLYSFYGSQGRSLFGSSQELGS